jgi:hypothetical protein
MTGIGTPNIHNKMPRPMCESSWCWGGVPEPSEIVEIELMLR